MSDVLVQMSYVTPIGELRLVASDRGLCGLVFADSRGCEWLTRHTARWFPSWPTAEYSPPRLALRQAQSEAEHRQSLDAARKWLDRYFDDPRSTDAIKVPLDMRGADFERRVWRALLKVRCGSTSTYGAIAKALGSPGAARAVGAANGANPVSLIVPCHRIIGSNGSLTGYGGGLHRKEWLLKHEGARLF